MTASHFRVRSSSSGPSTLSRAELARFLRRLAELYRDPVTGNLALSSALLDLSRNLPLEVDRVTSSEGRTLPVWSKKFGDLEKLNADAIKHYISDETKSKPELIELAMARFSIPHSRLMKMRAQEIRNFLRAALLHEDSISAIAEQAGRSGTHRSS